MSDFSMNSIKMNKTLFIISGLMLTIIVLEVIFRNTLFEASIGIIVSLQNNLPSVSKYIFQIVAGLCDPDIILPVYLLILAIQINKYFLVKLGLYICFIGYFLSVIKTIYGNPRPYWERPYQPGLPNYDPSQQIIPFEKYAEFGNPSGHAFFSTAFYGYLFYLFTLNHKRKQTLDVGSKRPLLDSESTPIIAKDKNFNIPAEQSAGLTCSPHPPVKKLWYRMLSVTFFLVIALVSASRMYLGMHSLNQVLMGLSLGLYFLYIFVIYIDERTEKFLKIIALQKLENRPLVIWTFCVCYVLASILPIILFIINDETNSLANSKLWTQWWIVVNQELDEPPNTFGYIRCLLDSGVIGGFFGILIGALASDGTYTETCPKFNTIPKIKIFFRVFVLFIVAGIPAAVLALTPVPEENYILNYFVKWNLALFMAGFSATRIVPAVYEKLDLAIEGDFLRIRMYRKEEST